MGLLRPVKGVIVPVVPTSLIGRAADLAGVRAELADPHTRLLTLTGPVGAGKSRLAAAIVLAGSMQVWSADLAGATDARSALPAVSLPAPGEAGLLVLDNCDQLAGAGPHSLVAPVADLLAAHRGLTVLATSCEPLGLYGERRFAVGPLPVPAEGEPAPEQVPAVALFAVRARAAAPGFTLGPDNRDDVAALCRELDGLPLALELAAGRIRVFPPGPLLARVRERLDVLEGRPGDTMSRHRTLRSALACGFDRLDPDEQTAVRRLSVFPGPFGLDAAHAVVGQVGRPVDLLLEALLDRSALAPVAGTEPRFVLLRTSRRYAAERLAESGELPDTYRRLAGWLHAADATHRHAVLSRTADPGRAHLLGHLADTLAADGDTAEAAQRAEEAVRVWTRLGDRRELARAQTLLAGLAAARSDHPRALELAQAALRVQWELADRPGLPPTLEVFAELAATDCTGLHHQSAVLLGAAAALRDLTRTPPTPRERAATARTTRKLATALGPAALRSATGQGRRADLVHVVEAALAARPTKAAPSPLTPREREVADLVARGLTNRQIARQLGIAEWTAVNHVRHIMRKLECPSRIHVARWMGRLD